MPCRPKRQEERLPVGPAAATPRSGPGRPPGGPASLFALVVLLVLLAACGGDEEPGATEAEPAAAVSITVTRDGRTREATLECDPNGGTHPSPDEACRALAANVGALDPVPGDVACTQIFGGPERARIEGTVSGRRVDARLSRSNGCEISRWDHLERVLDLDG